MNRMPLGPIVPGLLLFVMTQVADAQSSVGPAASHFPRAQSRASVRDFPSHGHWRRGSKASFNRIATLPNFINNDDPAAQTVSEIVSATADGRLLVYTDSPREQIGFVDITDPRLPISAGTLAVGGEPTSVAVLGNELALVAVDTSASFTDTSGNLTVVDVRTRTVRGTIPLGGQPDSIAISPDGRYAAIAIENERDEDLEVEGGDGGLPQSPAGYVVIVDVTGPLPADWGMRSVQLNGLASYGIDDPEPEFIDINGRNRAVVTLQENNHIVVVDLPTASIVSDFGAGSVDLTGIDTEEDGVISLTGTLAGVPREPDAVAWIERRNGPDLIATANEGDLFGGSRGFSIFRDNGEVLFDSGNSMEHLAVRHGHYPEERSENKGVEPEAIAFARFGFSDYLFVGSERGSFVAVYDIGAGGMPEFSQLLPAPLGPEGLLALPSRNLLIASGEEDDPAFGVRSTMMIYALQRDDADYPQILSGDDADRLPIPWSAMSGMTAVPGSRTQMLAVSDSFYAEAKIFTIDATSVPAVVTAAATVVGGSGDYDLEGIAAAPDGTLWLASEGNASGSRPNRLLQTDLQGVVLREIGLPDQIESCRAASENRGSLGSGFEGLAVLPSRDGYRLLVAQQRGWDYTSPECEALDDDLLASNQGEPPHTRIWIYDPSSGGWDFVRYDLEPVPPNASWAGLSEITRMPGKGYVVIERDNLTGEFAQLKTLAAFDARAMSDGVVSRREKSRYDLIPALSGTAGWISDKPEGTAITSDGRLFVITDNDGVDGWSGETSFLRLGPAARLFDNRLRRATGPATAR